MTEFLLNLIAKLPFVVIPSAIILFWAYRLPFHNITVQGITPASNIKCKIIIFALALISFVFLSLLLSTAWVKGDDWAFLSFSENTDFISRAKIALRRYFTWVSRGGEFYGTLIGLSYNKWQTWILVPIVTVMAPFAFFSLVKRKKEDSIYTPEGILFYCSILYLCLVGVNTSPWRNYYCYAAAINYLFPTTISLWFLSFFRSDSGEARTRPLKCAALFILGFFSGWGTECMSATLLPLLTIWVIYNLFPSHNKLPLHSYWGYSGFLFGCFALFASPALSSRSNIELNATGNLITKMSSGDLSIFLSNLDWDAVNSLRGVSGVITLKGIPIMQHFYFIPFISEIFLSCCAIGMISFAYFFTIHLLNKASNRRHAFIALSILLLSWLCAFSYLVQCIPSKMSFLPPCFILIAGSGYLMLRIDSILKNLVFSCLLLVGANILFIPAGIEAWSYKKYEKIRHQTIIELKKNRVEDIVLSRPYPKEPEDTLGLISSQDMKDTPSKYPNERIANYYEIKSIRQTSKK